MAIDPVNEIDHQLPKGMNKTDYIGAFIMRLKQLADDYNLLMICALHPPKDGVEKRLQKNGLLTLNDGADSANWGNKADIGLCMWRDLTGPTLLHIDKVKDHETMGRPTLCELIHDPRVQPLSDRPRWLSPPATGGVTMLTEDNRSALPELMKFTEALTLLKISRSKADRLIRSRDSDFPRPFKIGNERFFRASDLRSWIELKANASKWLAECRRRGRRRERG